VRGAISLGIWALLLLTVPAAGQTHAPTQEQCNADARVWGQKHDAEETLVDEHKLRLKELMSCIAAYPRNYDDYFVATSLSLVSMLARYGDFLKRHGSMPRFLDEDHAGKHTVLTDGHTKGAEQCRADATAWGQPANAGDAQFEEHLLRVDEMLSCNSTYASGKEAEYLFAGAATRSWATMVGRLEDFIKNHQMAALFEEEDHAGMR
jgi:hypothetical protein